jgi:hypothetical protein
VSAIGPLWRINRLRLLHAIDAVHDKGLTHRALPQCATGDGMVTVFEPASKQPLFTLRRPHAPGVTRIGTPAPGGGSATAIAAQLSPSGRLLATAGIDCAVKARDCSS